MAIETEIEKALYGITDSEMGLIIQLGLPNKIISQNLGISAMAVGMKINRISTKLGVENRTAIIIKALRLSLITIDQLVFREFNGNTNLS